MVGHLLGEHDGLLVRAEDHIVYNTLPVGILRGQAKLPHGMTCARDTEEVCVQRFVDTLGVATPSERVKQSCRYVARTGPKADPLMRIGHLESCFAARDGCA